MLSLPSILLNFRPQYHEQVAIRIELSTPASFVFKMPFILMNEKVTPSFVQLDLEDDDKFSGNEDFILDAEKINDSFFLKFLGFGQKLNLTSQFSSSPLSTQNYTALMKTHDFSLQESYNQTHYLVPLFFNSTIADVDANLSLLFTYSYKTCSNGILDPISLTLSHGWANYYLPKSLFLTTCK